MITTTIEPCEKCGKATHAHDADPEQMEAWGETWCRDCAEDERDRRSERAYERSVSDYYGGSTPQTIVEQQNAARALNRGGWR